jgi:antirestriction protein ArdC
MSKKKFDPYKELTDRIVKRLEEGEVPWISAFNNVNVGYPRNFITDKVYRGANFFMTLFEERETPYWLTYKQAKDLGGQVRKGEHGTPIIYFQFLDREDENGEPIRIPMVRRSVVFNLEQCDGIENPIQKELEAARNPVFNNIATCEHLYQSFQDKVAQVYHTSGGKSYYQPIVDKITMADKYRFHNEKFYYRTLFHELAHSTGHEDRLNRPGIVKPVKFGSPRYAREELVAELTSAFLCNKAGIVEETFEKSTSYISNWLEALKNDKMLVYEAMKDSFKAIEYLGILNEAA